MTRLSESGAAVAREMWDQLKDERPEMFGRESEETPPLDQDPIMVWLDRLLACPELWDDEPGFIDYAEEFEVNDHLGPIDGGGDDK